MKKKLMLATALLFASSAFADEGFEPHFIAGLGVGHVTAEASDDEFDLRFKGDDIAFRVFGGYQFTPYISTEVAYHNFGNVKDTIEGVNVGIKATAFEASVILSTSTVDRPFGAFARLGYTAWDADLKASDGEDSESWSEDGNDPTYGFGIWGQVENALLRLEYTRGEFEDVDMDLISASVVWRF